jgi:dipeptidyl aminopeptidase/acylaminoacyl peptidase
MPHARSLGLAALCALVPLTATAQKKPLTQADWDRWRSIQGATLSPDGRWAAYTLSPQVGDGEFVVRATSGSTEYRVPVGWIGRPNNTPGGARGAAAGGGGGGGRGGAGGGAAGGPFTADGRYALVSAQPPRAEQERAQAQRAGGRGGAGGGAGATTPSWLVLVDLATGTQTRIEGRNARLPRASGRWMAYAPAADSAARGDSAGAGRGNAAAPAAAGGRGGAAGAAAGGAARANGPRRTLGSAVVLRDLRDGSEQRLEDVVSYTFDDSAKVLAYVVGARDSTKDGLFLRDLSTGTTRTVLSGPGNYRGFTFDRAQQQFVFATDKDEWGKADTAAYVIYHGTLKAGTAAPIVRTAQLPAGMRLPESGGLGFTRSGTAITLSIAPPPTPAVPADSLQGKAVYDLWHWQDPQLQPAQLLSVARDRAPSYQAIYHLASKQLVRLTSDSLPSVSLSDDGRVGVANSGVRYNVARMWGDAGTDVYVVDGTTGAATLLAEKISGSASLSPGGKFVQYFHEGHWYLHQLATKKTLRITERVPQVRFDQETHSVPSTPGAWGIAGWTKDDRRVLIYDRYDVWEFDPLGVQAPVNVTDGAGRAAQVQLRLINLEPEEDRALDPARPLLLRAFGDRSKQSGFWRDQLGVTRAPERIVMADLSHGTPQKAADADVFLLTKSTVTQFPDLWVGPSLTQLSRISDANPWQAEYNWVTAELVEWLSADGVPLQGILYKPEDFDATKQYPLIAYNYEDLSDGLHNYVPPTGRNVINATHYASNGYLVFMPDIHYEEGYPGPSALKSIVPGVQMLLQRGYVDPKGLGIQGQSWGGYQASYIITQSNLFSAAMAGAPVANMTSAYGGIRWGSGLARAFQYETGQSRIGKSLWEGQQQYIENSPLFWLDRVNTPLFIMHNDQDDAVPWYQGIELFVGLRRLGKEVYMVNYNNDVHNPASRANQKDMAQKMQEFFDAKLKGAEPPQWMKSGIPAKDKGRDQLNAGPIRQ